MFAKSLLLIFGNLAMVTARDCEKGWLPFDDHCYYVSQQRLSFVLALSECRRLGAWLAATETMKEIEWLRLQLTLLESTHVYLGGTDQMEEGQWRWVHNGQTIQINNAWITAQPDGNMTENCLMAHQGYRYRLNDAPCSITYGYVCERPGKQQAKCQPRCC